MCKGDYVESVRQIMSYRFCGASENWFVKCLINPVEITCCQKKTLDKR